MSSQVAPQTEGLGRTVALRVTSYPAHIAHKYREQFASVLELRFCDVERTDSNHAEIGINEGHAKEIVSWVRANADADTMIINCDAGFSRSPAMALAVADILGLPDEGRKLRELAARGVYAPNRTVYDYLVDAAGLRAQRQADLEEVFSIPSRRGFI